MASSSVLLCSALLLLFALQPHARDTQDFTKLSSSVYGDGVAAETSKDRYENIPQRSDPVFQQENQNAYGLFSRNREAVKEPAATGVDFRRYLPKNYNPVAYVTQPEGFKERDEVQGKEKYYAVGEGEDSSENPSKYHHESYTIGNEDVGHGSFFGTGSRSNGLSSTSLRGGGGDAAFFPTRSDRFPQGMSDTRAVENGRYFYDVNSENFNGNHPYETMKQRGSNGYFVGNRRSYGVAGEGYQYGSWP